MVSDGHNPESNLLPSEDALFELAKPQIPYAELTPREREQRDRSIGVVAIDGNTTSESSAGLPSAMKQFREAISLLGKSNRSEGLDYLASTAHGRITLVQRFGKDAWRVEEFNEGGSQAYEQQARTAYSKAINALTGEKLEADDPWILDGYRKFFAHYAQTGRAAQAQRKVAQGKLAKGIADSVTELPIEHYFDTEHKVYADSWSHGNRSWSDVVHAYAKDSDYDAGPEVGASDDIRLGDVLSKLQSDPNVLRSTEKPAVIDNTDVYFDAIASKVKKTHFERWKAKGETGVYPVEAQRKGQERARLHVREQIQVRVGQVDARQQQLGNQFTALEGVETLIRSNPEKQPIDEYRITDETLQLVEDVLGDMLHALSALGDYEREDTQVVIKKLFSQFMQPDGLHALEITPVLQKYINMKYKMLRAYKTQLNATLAQYAD